MLFGSSIGLLTRADAGIAACPALRIPLLRILKGAPYLRRVTARFDAALKALQKRAEPVCDFSGSCRGQDELAKPQKRALRV
jgi:hypothetical protein